MFVPNGRTWGFSLLDAEETQTLLRPGRSAFPDLQLLSAIRFAGERAGTTLCSRALEEVRRKYGFTLVGFFLGGVPNPVHMLIEEPRIAKSSISSEPSTASDTARPAALPHL